MIDKKTKHKDYIKFKKKLLLRRVTPGSQHFQLVYNAAVHM